MWVWQVGGVDLRDASHEQAVEAIRNAGNPVVFLVQSIIHKPKVSIKHTTQPATVNEILWYTVPQILDRAFQMFSVITWWNGSPESSVKILCRLLHRAQRFPHMFVKSITPHSSNYWWIFWNMDFVYDSSEGVSQDQMCLCRYTAKQTKHLGNFICFALKTDKM